MKNIVSKLVCAALSLGLLAIAMNVPSRGEIIHPFCKVGGGDLSNPVCNYSSFEQCREASAGYGMCTVNPAYVPPAATPAAQRRAKRG
ncbi:MAG TPA: DUF3551 domain-containing protein [Burkholderiales bacterium]|nr:DUF3551 domain-containing protein [Burkholderiales bacterium]